MFGNFFADTCSPKEIIELIVDKCLFTARVWFRQKTKIGQLFLGIDSSGFKATHEVNLAVNTV
ncbi:MAG: hypothetical protein WAM42_16615 [Candidatus Nitrosopolaris sp.]